MSRFANPNATERFVLPGPCACPGQPHDEDWMRIRVQLGGLETLELGQADSAERLRLLVVEWNLLDEDGSSAEMDDDHFRRLYDELFEPLDVWLKAHIKTSTLPNGSSAPSRNGSRGSASQTRAIPKTG